MDYLILHCWVLELFMCSRHWTFAGYVICRYFMLVRSLSSHFFPWTLIAHFLFWLVSNLSVFPFINCAFSAKNSLPSQRSWRFSCFLPKSFIVLHCTFMFINCFELIFVQSERFRLRFVCVAYSCPTVRAPFVEKRCLPLSHFFCNFF